MGLFLSLFGGSRRKSLPLLLCLSASPRLPSNRRVCPSIHPPIHLRPFWRCLARPSRIRHQGRSQRSANTWAFHGGGARTVGLFSHPAVLGISPRRFVLCVCCSINLCFIGGCKQALLAPCFYYVFAAAASLIQKVGWGRGEALSQKAKCWFLRVCLACANRPKKPHYRQER